MQQEHINAFQQRWDGCSLDAFKRALQEGDESHRLVAIFALGYLADKETRELLVPFLASPVRKERWAGTIVLGEHRDERVFPLLGQLLVEHMEYVSPSSEQDVWNSVCRAIEQAREHYGTPIAWQHFVEPDVVQKWNELEGHQGEYIWYLIHRITITNIFGAWGNPQAIPILRQAFQRCWQLEQTPQPKVGCLAVCYTPGTGWRMNWPMHLGN